MNLKTWRAKWTAFAASVVGQQLIRLGGVALMVGVVGYLVYKLAEIGWSAVWEALPVNPWFYLLFLLLYVQLPLFEVLIYRLSWTFPAWRSLPAFLKKRIYNKDVLEYSGEVYFFTWARQQLGLTDREIGETIRDNNILSSVASTFITVLLVGIFLFIGDLNLQAWLGEASGWYIIAGAAVIALVIALGIRFRQYLFSMPLRLALVILAIQCGRLVLGQVLQIAQWAVVLPEVPLSTWFTYAAVSIVLTRIPLPNQRLIFMGIGTEMSTHLGVPEAAVFSMLGVLAALDKVVNAALFLVISMQERRAAKTSPETAPQAPSATYSPAAQSEPPEAGP